MRRLDWVDARRRAARVQRTYLVLTLLTTLAASFIWGINTLFLLDAGLDNTRGVRGQRVLHRRPGAVRGPDRRRRRHARPAVLVPARRRRRCSVATLLYLVMWQVQAPLLGWAIASILLGLGFTFFSGATEAWLVDALDGDGLHGHPRDRSSRRAQIVGGVAMLDRIGRSAASSPRRPTSACRTCCGRRCSA